MRYGHLLAMILIVLAVLTGVYAFGRTKEEKIDVKTPRKSAGAAANVAIGSSSSSSSSVYTEPILRPQNTVVFDGNGFSPDHLSISKGDTVLFENKSGGNMWVASDSYPERGICGSAFNSCGAVQPGASWYFRFDNSGNWQYYEQTRKVPAGTIFVK